MSSSYPWWCNLSVEAQISKVRYFIDSYTYTEEFAGQNQSDRTAELIPAPPQFTPYSPTEILLLAVYFHDSWVKGSRHEKKLVKKADPEDKFSGISRTVHNWLTFIPLEMQIENIMSEQSLEHLESVACYNYQPGIRWVGFDPFTYQNISPISALNRATDEGRTLAGPEVLMSIALFPEIVHSEKGMRASSLAALRLQDWRGSVPCIQYIPRHQKVHPTGWLELSRDWEDSVARGNCYCPTVRDL